MDPGPYPLGDLNPPDPYPLADMYPFAELDPEKALKRIGFKQKISYQNRFNLMNY